MSKISHEGMILERIKQYIDFKGISIAAFERSIGMANASFGKSLKRQGAIGTDKLENILMVYPDISPMWLLKGLGEMLLQNGDIPTTKEQNRVSTGDYSPVNLHGTMEVRQTTMADTSRELELLRAQLEEKERVIQAQRDLINEKQKMIDLLQR